MTMFTGELLESFEDSVTDVATACTLPPELYTSEEFLAFERRALFEHEWCCVGVASRIPETGDWFTATVSTEPIIVVRHKDGSIRAFSAICRHRGMQVAEGEGNNRAFRCPYHHWSYRLDGRLLGAPAMEHTDDFDKADWGLPNLAVELWYGFVFVNFNPEAPPLAPTLGRYEPYLTNYELDDCVCPGTFHPDRPALELEGHVRELQRRLPRQPPPRGDPGLLPLGDGQVPGAVVRRLQRDL